jgi:hypothetical protein
MTNQTTAVSHNGAVYDLRIGGWLQHRHSEAAEAIREIATEDILLPNGQKAGPYRAEKRAEYDAQPRSAFSNAKKHLNHCSLRDFGCEWDKLISEIKQEINDRCLPLLVAAHELSIEQKYEILTAASNGHVGAMFWIGATLRGGEDDNCLLWLSMAHNRGHVGACYEMAVYLSSKGNFLEALRCWIVSLDGGCDLAFMSIFSYEVMVNMCKIEQVSLLEQMLDELATTNSSSARYLKGMLMLLQGKKTEGMAVLKAFLKAPKRLPSIDQVDTVHENQIKLVMSFVEGVLKDIASGIHPLPAVRKREQQTQFFTVADYDEVIKAVQRTRRSS